ncbi:FAD:protein FMN transferase [Clostridium sp. CTA-5]
MINMLLVIFIMATLLILVFLFTKGNGKKYLNNKSHSIVRSSYSLGTIINLKACGSNAEEAIEKSIKRLNNIDDKMSVFKENSEISMINSKAGIESQIVGKDTYFVLKKSLEYSKILKGTFDPTIRPLVSLWNISGNGGRIPNEDEIKSKIKLVNYNDIILDENSHSVMLKHKNQSLDVGGIAKGFAADEVRNIFYKYDIKSALIDLGGNIFALGLKEDGSNWKVGIQNPIKTRGEHIGLLNVKNKSVVTSGNYERYFMEDGKKFHHIIDPKTGYPSESEIISATIISDNSIDGDGLSTGIYILGINKAISIIESMQGIDGILVTADKKIYITSGIKDDFILTDNEFSI